MAFLDKTYKYEKEENFDAFIDSLDLPAERAGKLKSFKPEYKIVKDGDTYTLITAYPGGNKELSFQDGVEFEESVTGDLKSKTTFTVSGNTVTQVQKFDNGRIMTFKRDYTDDKLVVTITTNLWDGTARRYYAV